MKRYIASIVALVLFMSINVFATPLDFSGGVANEYLYEEFVFITGTPIKFTGKYTVSEKEKADEETVSYKFTLTSEDPSLEGKLDRTVTYVTALSSYDDKGQTTGQTSVSKYKETVKLGADSYTLTDYQFSKSDIIDSRPAADFYSGNMVGRKVYTLNRNQGTVTVDITGGNVGYENFWGSTETQVIDHIIKANLPAREGETENNWQGTVSVQVSDSLTKSLRYSENNANFSSFDGGYVRVTEEQMVSKYDYYLPSARGTLSLNQERVPKLESLIVPKFRDVNGHWAEDHIKKLYSLNVFEGNSDIFSPNTPANRLEFTKAIMRACDIRVNMEETKTSRSTRRKRNEPVEVSYFKDIAVDHADYQYVKSGVDRQIVQGVSKDSFGPNQTLTRAQAITILIRALGFENRAPNPGYYTSFSDDRMIPSWAKDSIYMAQQIGLVQGDAANRVNPNQPLTRAETSTLIVRFLEFLEKDLQKDYREHIMNFN
ncbi:MAG: S-layer homology domain-containing protein [Epulopiscium sp.]|mgnify:CR=1 FL=1|nr:S-layer homology domain-containing protein [Candidatus Epulonipiscium sp.]